MGNAGKGSFMPRDFAGMAQQAVDDCTSQSVARATFDGPLEALFRLARKLGRNGREPALLPFNYGEGI